MAQGAGHGRDELLGVVEEARRTVRSNPRDADAYRALGRALRQLGANEEANDAELDAIEASQHDPELRRAAHALASEDLAAAESILRSVVSRRPDDAAAVRMLADVAIWTGHASDAEKLARHALHLAPGFEYARYTLAIALGMIGYHAEALQELQQISGPLADHDGPLTLRAEFLGKLGETEQAVQLYRELVHRNPNNVGLWLSMGDQLRFAGDQQGAADAYRKALEIQPTKGEAWWSLANIKTVDFSDRELALMEGALGSRALNQDDRSQLHFAIGKALEDRGKHESSFEHYRQGNEIRSARTHYDSAASTRLVEATKQLFTAEFLGQRKTWGCKARDPIFIVGLTRSGSTLIEQILASHSEVEGTDELADVILLAKELEQMAPGGAAVGWRNYPGILRKLSADDFLRLGETYLERTCFHRKTNRPFFTDKMPNNWFHVGLIRLMLPNAKIIDARRHPLACGFSNFKQYYAQGQEFTYDLERFGLYYRDYVQLMGHFDQVSPGAIHRVIYERLVSDPEREIRSLLNFIGLPFDEACLRFYETKRAVRTVSAQQVRRPLDPSHAADWKRFEPWLDPLKQALGDALEQWDRDIEAANS